MISIRQNSGSVSNNNPDFVLILQMVCVLSHTISHVQVRGSVPVYWSQPGVRYKPLPVIDRSKFGSCFWLRIYVGRVDRRLSQCVQVLRPQPTSTVSDISSGNVG